MRKLMLIIGICLLFLCGCSSERGSERSIQGTVLEVIAGEKNQVQFLMEIENNSNAMVCFDDETLVHSWINGVDVEKFKQGEILPAKIMIHYEDIEKINFEKNEEMNVYIAKEIGILGIPTEDVYVLKDGTQLEIWQETNGMEYRLDDGTVLVGETSPNGPENTSVPGENGLEQLPEVVQQKINTYYEEQGILYDINTELERAYSAYQENPEEFSTWRFFQDCGLSASNENIVAFLTTLQVLDGKTTDDKRSCTVFNRTTGEKIDVYDLFVYEKENVAEEILKAAKIKPETLVEEMKQAFRPEYIMLFENSLQISFPAGTLPSQEHQYIVSVDRAKDLKELLHEWAIPIKTS